MSMRGFVVLGFGAFEKEKERKVNFYVDTCTCHVDETNTCTNTCRLTKQVLLAHKTIFVNFFSLTVV